MSDHEEDEDVPPMTPSEDSNLDADGFHVVSNRGKFAERSNPLQERMREERRRAEMRAAELAKKAKLAAKLAAFGGGVTSTSSVSTDTSATSAIEKKKSVPEMHKGPLDSKIKEMMSSGIVTQKVKAPALLSSRGRGRGGTLRGTREAKTDVEGEVPGDCASTPSSSPTAATTATTPTTATSTAHVSDSDSEEERRKRMSAARRKVAEAKAAAALSVTSGASSPTSTLAAQTTLPITRNSAVEGKRRATMLVAAMHQKRESVATAMLAAQYNMEHNDAGATSAVRASRGPSAMFTGLSGAVLDSLTDAEREEIMESVATDADAACNVIPLGSQFYCTLREKLQDWVAEGLVDAVAPERVLMESELVRALEVNSRAEFDNLPLWKRTALRKKAKLFVEVTA